MYSENQSDVDRYLSVLSDRRRRDVLYGLQKADGDAMTLDELVHDIACRDVTADTEPTADHLQELKVRLYHVHLPLLADHGIIGFDPRSKTIRYWADSPTEELLESVDDLESREELSAWLAPQE
jgi:hypothetical protein